MTVLTKSYHAPKILRREVLRYAKANTTPECEALLDSVIEESKEIFTYKVAYTVLDVKRTDRGIDFGAFFTESDALIKNLGNSQRVIVFGATVGLSLDRLVAKYSRLSPARALMLNALGAERIEALCDEFTKDMEKECGAKLRPRFSPGYADLPLTVQKEIFNLLDLPRRIGITLTDTMLMSPTKSVTAFIGMEK